jgi:Rod binding domain-containing protein
MFDKEVSTQLAKRNSMGLADMLVKNLEQQQAAIVTTSEMLKMREEGGMPPAKPISLNPKETAIPLNADQRPAFKLPKSGAIPLNMMPGLGKNFDRNSL